MARWGPVEGRLKALLADRPLADALGAHGLFAARSWPLEPLHRMTRPAALEPHGQARRRWVRWLLGGPLWAAGPGAGLLGCAGPGPTGRAAAPSAPWLDWAALAPAGWHPLAPLLASGSAGRSNLAALADLAALDDTLPEYADLWRALRQHWDNAPGEPALHGRPAQLAGFLLPLATEAGAPPQALLVAAYGACTHTPAPAAHQIVRLQPGAVAQRLGPLGAVRAQGVLQLRALDSALGRSAWWLAEAKVQPWPAPLHAPPDPATAGASARRRYG